MKTTYVENITAFISNMRPSKQEEQGPVGPVPVITIDGVDYYHKCEFDLEAIASETEFYQYDLLTGEAKQNISPCLDVYLDDDNTKTISLKQNSFGAPVRKILYPTTEYQSMAFVIIDEQTVPMIESNQIVLPTCSAYYGFLSEDGKTFISYFNLKEE